MINMASPISITSLNYKKNTGFCPNIKNTNFSGQNAEKLCIPSPEHIKSRFYPAASVNKISFGMSFRQIGGLTAKDVVERMNEQLNIISPKQVQAMIDSFDESARPLAARIMQRLTQFANMQSLNKIAEYTKEKDRSFFYRSNDNGLSGNRLIDLSTTMNYLSLNKKAFELTRTYFPNISEFYLLDRTALEELERNQAHLDKIKNPRYEANVRILYSEGWINGINPFNQSDYLKEKVKKLLPEVQKLQEKQEMSQEQALSTALNQEIVERIEKLGLQDKFEILRNKELENAPCTAEQISKQMAPASMKAEELEQVINKLPEASRQIMLEYLHKNADVYSPRRLSISLQKLHAKFQREGMLGEGTYYYVPKTNQSYGMIAMMYKLANNIPNEKFIYNCCEIPENANRVIILDDVAGSGDSLAEHQSDLKDMFSGQIVIAPVISTYEAAKVLSGSTFFPYRLKEQLTDSDFFKSLNGKAKYICLEEIDGLGHNHNGLSVVFPYMAPDNDNKFFARYIAPKFTLNGKGITGGAS